MAIEISFVAVIPGLDGNRISVDIEGDTNVLATVAVVVVTSDFIRYRINLTVGYNAGTGKLNVADWNAVATLFNASTGGTILTATGNALTTLFIIGVVQAVAGSDGNGAGQYYSTFAPTPPPAYTPCAKSMILASDSQLSAQSQFAPPTPPAPPVIANCIKSLL